jgi:hypothetical protein
MMVSLPSTLLALSSVARAAGPGPAAQASVWALAVSAARTVELLPSVLVAAWAPAPAVLLPPGLLMLPSVARAAGPVSAARTVELLPSVLVAARAPAPVSLPMVPGL